MAENGELEALTVTNQEAGEPRQSAESLRRDGAIRTYRPFLSYNELGSMLEERPSDLYDALEAMLGLGELVNAIERLRQERLARDGLRLLGEVADSEGGWREGDAPPSGWSSPARMRSSVVLPTPLGPTTPRRVPGPMVTLTRSRIGVAPWDRTRSVATREAPERADGTVRSLSKPLAQPCSAASAASASAFDWCTVPSGCSGGA
jgi:hypothetical protein